MEDWMDNNVHFDGYPSEDAPDPGATVLAEQCVVQAREDEITKEELEAEFGDLPMYMHQGMSQIADAENARKAAKND
jgi:hypothetical protein